MGEGAGVGWRAGDPPTERSSSCSLPVGERGVMYTRSPEPCCVLSSSALEKAAKNWAILLFEEVGGGFTASWVSGLLRLGWLSGCFSSCCIPGSETLGEEEGEGGGMRGGMELRLGSTAGSCWKFPAGAASGNLYTGEGERDRAGQFTREKPVEVITVV